MRILDLYTGRFTYYSASTIFVNSAVFIGVCMCGVYRFIERVKGH